MSAFIFQEKHYQAFREDGYERRGGEMQKLFNFLQMQKKPQQPSNITRTKGGHRVGGSFWKCVFDYEGKKYKGEKKE